MGETGVFTLARCCFTPTLISRLCCVKGVMCGRSVRVALAPAIASAIPVTPATSCAALTGAEHSKQHRCMTWAESTLGYAASAVQHHFSCNLAKLLVAVEAAERITCVTCRLQQCSPVPAPKSTAWTSCHCPKGGCLSRYSARTKALCQTTRPTFSRCSVLLSRSAHQKERYNPCAQDLSNWSKCKTSNHCMAFARYLMKPQLYAVCQHAADCRFCVHLDLF